MFFGNQQHDSQEFLSFFLDKMSEDLNRIEEDDEDEEQLDKKSNNYDSYNNQKQDANKQEAAAEQNQSSITSTVKANLSPPSSLPIQNKTNSHALMS